MDSKIVKMACEEHKEIVNKYYKDNGKKLYMLIDKVLFKLKFDVEKTDFYSLGNEIFLDALCRYDGKQDFNGFLYSCLINKFKTEMTRRTRQKRRGDKRDFSLDEIIGNEEDGMTIGELIADKDTVESKVFEEDETEWRKEVKEYLEKLSPLQKQIAFLLADNNTPNEICEELHITMKHFENSIKRILADERIRPLRVLMQ